MKYEKGGWKQYQSGCRTKKRIDPDIEKVKKELKKKIQRLNR